MINELLFIIIILPIEMEEKKNDTHYDKLSFYVNAKK